MSAENGKKIGDGTGVGFFIPLPESLANQFSSLGDTDKSPTHCTFLYAGEVPKDKEELFVKTATFVFSSFRKTVTGVLDYMDYFTHAEKERRVAVMRVNFNEHLDELRWKLRDALMGVGFQIDDSFPLVYQPHVTLEYFDDLKTEYDGTIPQGSWTFDSIEIWGLSKLYIMSFIANPVERLASKYVDATKHATSIELMKFLAKATNKLGIGEHVYVVGGAVRNFIINEPIKDIDVVIDSVKARKDSSWLAKQFQRMIPARTSLVTNQYGVAILTVKDDWYLGDSNLRGEVIEIANARKESYGEVGGKGYKPHMVEPSTIEEDVVRREFTFNTLLWQMSQLAKGPDKVEILDLTGCGKKDLSEGMMRCPSDPNKTFSDDPSRMIRAIKFLLKYGFQISPEVKSAIKRNAQKLKNIPPGHLSNMIINLFFEPGYGKKALIEMKKLGLLDIVRQIAVQDKAFREALANWADKNAKVDFLLDLMDYNMPTGRKLNFLNKKELVRLREITAPLASFDADYFISILQQPGKLVNMEKLISDFGLRGQDIRKLTDAIRSALLDNPKLSLTPAKLELVVSKNMGIKRVAKVYKPSDFQPAFNAYTDALHTFLLLYIGFLKEFKGFQDTYKGQKAYKLKSRLNNPWVKVIKTGYKLSEIIFDQKEIPKKDTKKMEMAARLFVSAKRTPKDFEKWITKNERHLQFILNSKNWLDLSEGGDSLFKLGSFLVHNTINASDKDLDIIKSIFTKTEQKIKAVGSPFSIYKKVLYGDVFVVGRISGMKTLAWYMAGKDLVYIRKSNTAIWDDVQTLAHELAHRLWDKFLPNDVKKRWVQHHHKIQYGGANFSMPEVGDVLPFSVNRVKHPKILSVNDLGGGYIIDADKKSPGVGISIDRGTMRKWLKQEAEVSKFPTRYSATNPEEHFCEAMALMVVDDLSKEHLDALKEAFTGKDGDSDYTVKFGSKEPWQMSLREFQNNMKVQRLVWKKTQTFDGFLKMKGINKSDLLSESEEADAIGGVLFRKPNMTTREKGKLKSLIKKKLYKDALYKEWQDTTDSFKSYSKLDLNKISDLAYLRAQHKRYIRKALHNHNHVPDKILNLYPELVRVAAIKELRGWKKEINVGNAKWTIYTNPNKKERIIDRGSGVGRWLLEEWWTEDKHKAPYWMEAELAPSFKKLWAVMRRGPKPSVKTPNPIKTPPELRGWKRSLDKQRNFHHTVFTSPDGQIKIREGKPNFYSANNHEWTSFVKSRGGWHLDQMEKDLGKLLRVMKRIDKIAAKFQKKKEVPKADGKGTTTVYEYSQGQIDHRNRSKAKRVEALRGKLDHLQKAIKKDLNSKDEQTRMIALAVGLINDTFERVGNSSSAKDGHFGVTGWQVNHVTLGKNKATFKYVGKSGVSQVKMTTDKDLIRVLRGVMEGKGSSDPIFKTDAFTVDSGKINHYLKSFDITAKDIRGLHANRQVQKALKSIRSAGGKLPTDPKEKKKKLKKEFKQAIEQAAKAVGHEPATLKNQYLVPGLEDNYIKDGTVKENLAKQKKATKNYAEKEDDAVSKLVKSLPKKNPPRHDLRNERVNVDGNPDADGGAEQDKDMSLNYKRVAGFIDHWAASKKRPGEIWKTDSGWSVKLEEDNIRSFDSESEAKEALDHFRKGDGKSDDGNGKKKKFDGVDTKSDSFKELSEQYTPDLAELAIYMKAIIDGEDVNLPPKLLKSKAFKDLGGMPIDSQHVPIDSQHVPLVKSLVKAEGSPYADVIKKWDSIQEKNKGGDTSKTDKDESVSDKDVDGFYSSSLSSLHHDPAFKSVLGTVNGLGSSDKIKLVKSFQQQIKNVKEELASGSLSERTIKAASNALKNPSSDGSSLALAVLAKKFIANPMYQGGSFTGLGGQSDLDSLQKKASKSADYYSGLTIELRQEAVTQIQSKLKTLAGNSPEKNELEKIADGLHYASILQGDFDDPDEGFKSIGNPPSSGLKDVLTVLSKNGKDKEILDAIVKNESGGLNSSIIKEQLKESLLSLSDADFYDACGGEDGGDAKTIGLLKNGRWSTKERKYIKQMLVDGLVDDVSASDTVATLIKDKKKLKLKKDNSEKNTDSNGLLGGHDDTDIDWVSAEDNGESLLDVLNSISDEFRNHRDGIRESIINCIKKAPNAEAAQKCSADLLNQSFKVSNKIKQVGVWDVALNAYRLNQAKIKLDIVEDALGVLSNTSLFKVQILTALQLSDASELDKKYVKESS